MDLNPQLESAVMSETFCCAVHHIVRQLPFVPGLLDLCVRQHMLVFVLPALFTTSSFQLQHF